MIVRNLSAAPAKLHIDAPGGSPSGADSTALACNLAAVSVGVFGAWQVSVDGQPVLASDDDSIPELSPEERMEVRMTVDAAGDPQLDSVGAIAIGAGVFNDASGLAPLLPSPADCAS